MIYGNLNVAYPGNRLLNIVNGLGAQKFGQSDRNYMSNEIMKSWISCAFELANQLPTTGYRTDVFQVEVWTSSYQLAEIYIL